MRCQGLLQVAGLSPAGHEIIVDSVPRAWAECRGIAVHRSRDTIAQGSTKSPASGFSQPEARLRQHFLMEFTRSRQVARLG